MIGIQQYPKLRVLSLRNCQVQTLEPLLAVSDSLQRLDCSNNRLSDLNKQLATLGQMRQLYSVVLAGNDGLLQRPASTAAPEEGEEIEMVPIDPTELVFEVLQVMSWLELFDNRRITVADRKAAHQLRRDRLEAAAPDVLELEPDDDAEVEDDE